MEEKQQEGIEGIFYAKGIAEIGGHYYNFSTKQFKVIRELE